jgi:hypothetical protein
MITKQALGSTLFGMADILRDKLCVCIDQLYVNKGHY